MYQLKSSARSTGGAPTLIRRRRRRLFLLGPAFVAGIAYVDPGNIATNVTAGAQFGYLLVWVIVAANLMAMLVQYLSAKLGIATGESLPSLCRKHFSRRVSFGLWVQAEAVALATDLAEVLGGAIALQLLFGIPLMAGGVITGGVSLVILALQRPGQQRRFEFAIIYLLGVIVVGFLWSMIRSRPDPVSTLDGLLPRLEGSDSVLLAAGIIGATVMPHAIYLHSALIRDRFGPRQRPLRQQRQLLTATRIDVVLAMAIAGAVNLAMVLTAAGALQGKGIETLDAAYHWLEVLISPATALLFAVALLASGLASSSVGTYAGSVILEGFLQRNIALPARRLVTLLPALAILATDLDPTRMLVLSQVVLSFGIPFALWPLLVLTRQQSVMGELVNTRLTSAAAFVVAALLSALNVVLLVLTTRTLA